MKLLLLLLAACAGEPEPNATLSNLRSPSLVLEAGPTTDEATTVNVELGYMLGDFLESHDYDCATLDPDRVTVTLDDQPLAMIEPGHTGGDRGALCALPMFGGAVQLNTARLVIADDTAKLTAEFDGLETRRATLTSHTAWTFAPGESVSVTWSHSDAESLRVELVAKETFVLDRTVSGNEIRFALPRTVHGNAELRFIGNTVRGRATSCLPTEMFPGSCISVNALEYVHAVAIGS